ncbi:MAG: murein peptide amidase [Thermoleophilaceae bacterium]|nr:murein peptide amidase [Thermoleophilaceae bacterium]
MHGTPIRAYRVGPANADRTVLVVGEIHGNERAGEAVARRLMHVKPPDGVAFWLVPELNPDGARAGTRQNAHGVDLNRNFAWNWKPLDRPGGTFYSGPRAFSEPESRAAKRLVRRIRPRVAVWYHQHLSLVDEASGGDGSVIRRYARLVGLPAKRLPRYTGRAVGWENREVPGGTAFVVELGAGSLSDADQHRHAVAVLRLARQT